MKNQINISNLTPEQIEDLKQQLKAYDEQPKSIMDMVMSWEDAAEIIDPSYYVSNLAEIKWSATGKPAKICVPSEKHAKSILAACQLMVIAEALNEGRNVNPIAIRLESGKLRASTTTHYGCYSQIKFKDFKTGEYAIAQFEDLWCDYFMIDKPEQQ